MCDYSLDLVASRPAKVGDKLVTTKFHRRSIGNHRPANTILDNGTLMLVSS